MFVLGALTVTSDDLWARIEIGFFDVLPLKGILLSLHLVILRLATVFRTLALASVRFGVIIFCRLGLFLLYFAARMVGLRVVMSNAVLSMVQIEE